MREDNTAFDEASKQSIQAPQENKTSAVTWHVASRPCKHRAIPDTKTGRLQDQLKKLKANVYATVVRASCPRCALKWQKYSLQPFRKRHTHLFGFGLNPKRMKVSSRAQHYV